MFEATIRELQKQQLTHSIRIELKSKIYISKKQKKSSSIVRKQKMILKLDEDIPSQAQDSIQTWIKNNQINVCIQKNEEASRQFENYGQISSLFKEQKIVLTHQNQQILLVDIWATWCLPCQALMNENQQLLKKHEQQWKNKVRFVAVSLDEDRELLINRVNSKNWYRMQHLSLGGYDCDHKLIKDFKVKSIPFVVLVDQKGKIRFKGNPLQINILKQIQFLINQENTKHQNYSKWQAQQVQELQKIIVSEKFQHLFANLSYCDFEFVIDKMYDFGKITAKIKINIQLFNDQIDFISSLKTQLQLSSRIIWKINTIQTISVPSIIGKKCWNCQKNIKFPAYWLKWQEDNQFGCIECIQASQNEFPYFNYNKNTILLLNEWNKIPLKILGNNLQPVDSTKVLKNHACCCNKCGSFNFQIGKVRYICLICTDTPESSDEFIDFCQKCVRKLMDTVPSEIKQNQYVQSCYGHPLLRILYNIEGYNQF